MCAKRPRAAFCAIRRCLSGFPCQPHWTGFKGPQNIQFLRINTTTHPRYSQRKRRRIHGYVWGIGAIKPSPSGGGLDEGEYERNQRQDISSRIYSVYSILSQSKGDNYNRDTPDPSAALGKSDVIPLQHHPLARFTAIRRSNSPPRSRIQLQPTYATH